MRLSLAFLLLPVRDFEADAKEKGKGEFLGDSTRIGKFSWAESP
jgi:hypothetical protein